jgi:hypothetical protein
MCNGRFRGTQMVICIDKFLPTNNRERFFRFTEMAARRDQIDPAPEDNDPDDDPPSTVGMAA